MAEPKPIIDDGEFWINAAGRRIPKVIPDYGVVRPYAGAFATPAKSEGLPTMKPAMRKPRENKMLSDIQTALKTCGAHDGMTLSFHHHLRGGDGVLVNVLTECRKMGFKNIRLAPSSLHDGQKPLIEMFKDGTVTHIDTGANDSLGLSVTAGDLKGMMVVRSHGGRVRAVKEGDIKIDIAFIGASCADNQGNCNGVLGKSAFGPMAYSAIDARFARHTVVVTDNLVEYPCTPISITESFIDYVVSIPSIGDPKKIVGGTTRLSTDPQNLLIGEYCARLMDALGLLTPEFVFQAGSGGTSLTSMTALSTKLQAKGISARMANGGTTCILVDMLKKGLVRKLTTCQAFDLVAVKSMIEDWPKHVETDIDQYANPSNCGSVVNNLDVMVAGGTEVDVCFNCNVNTHSDGSFQHNTGGHQDTAAGARLTIITMPVARRCNPGIVDRVTSITTPGECVGAICTEEGVAINPIRKDLLKLLEGKTEAELGFKLLTIEQLRARGIEKAGRRHTTPRTLDRIIGVIEWRDGTVLDVVRQPLDRKGMGINSARVEVKTAEGPISVKVECIDDCPYVTAEATEKLAHDMLKYFGIESNCQVSIMYDYAHDFNVAASLEVALRKALGDRMDAHKVYLLSDRKAYPAPQRNRPLRRSHLYIPGADGYMVGKAGTSPADAVILDLEDSVDPEKKEFARCIIRHALRGAVDFNNVEKMIRINGVNELGFRDLEAVLPYATVDVIVVPKVESRAEIELLEKKLCEVLHVEKSPVFLICLIESALGVERAFEICGASPNIIGVSMGLEDYTADRGVERTESDDESQWAMNRVANAAVTAGVQMIDVVYSTLDDNEGLEKSIIRARKMGLFGKRCIHPNQCHVINKGFNPAKPDVDESCSAITAYLKSDGGVVKITGKKGKAKMVDKPVLIRAVHCVSLAVAVGMLPAEPWNANMAAVLKRIGM